MIRQTAVVGAFQCNCMLLGCEKTKEAVLIDPGDEPQKIIDMVEKSGMKVKYLLHTHAHLDHIGATGALHSKWKVPPCLHKDDEKIFQNLKMQGQMFGIEYDDPPAIEKFLADEEIVTFGEHRLQVIHTPGHSPGSICLKLQTGDESVFSGDTLFQMSVGRSDLWGGNHETLVSSIKRRLFTLNDDIQVFPGHGDSTKIGIEKRGNPFLQ